MIHFSVFLFGVVLSCTPNLAWAQFYDGRTLLASDPTELTRGILPGTILILGENHGLQSHQDQHMAILKQLRAEGLKISVGLEFVNYTDQIFVEQYRTGELSVDQFLSVINWTGFSFEYYRTQFEFPLLNQGEVSLGLNLPRSISSKISKLGVDGLSETEKGLLPPNFEVGRDSYKNRFREVAGGHCANFENCFAAQSSWDDTMAWRATEFIKSHPDQVLVIIVGEFHVQYGGGLADRISKRLPGITVKTLSQIWAEGMTDEEIQVALQPSVLEGPRADFIWVSKPASK